MRLSQATEGDAHPDAIAQARALEAHGYVEMPDVADLYDDEDLMFVDHARGGVAPGRYHRVGGDPDHLGRRDEHVLEVYPGSRYSDMLPYAKTLRTLADGTTRSRIGIYRPTRPEHALHGPPLYNLRAARDRGEA